MFLNKNLRILFVFIVMLFCGGLFFACQNDNSKVKYTVSITSNISGAFKFNGITFQKLTEKNPNFNDVEVSANAGYVFKYYEIDGEKYYSNTIKIEEVNKNTEVVVVADYATYELPIINIDTKNVSIKSKINYTDMNFTISNCENEIQNVSGGIRVRGNSTSNYEKKPYRIKFDESQSLFGLPKAKSWVLLAEYLDPSALHNYTAFKLGEGLDNLSFTPTPNKVNVYLNGKFVGLYTLCEQVQENKGRMGIELDEITEDMTELKDFNFFICMDYSVASDPDGVLNENYFYLDEYEKYFELKYPEKDQFVSEEQFNKFFNDLKIYVKEIMDTFYNKDVDKIKSETNIKSLIDYLIVDQIMGEEDHARKSFNMYFTHTSQNPDEKNKLNFGPIWDYDWSLFTPFTGQPNESYYINSKIQFSNIFFRAIENIPEFYNLLKARYISKGSQVLSGVISSIYNFQSSISESLKLNNEVWYKNFDKDITKKNIEFLNNFLIKRKEVLDENWGK